MSSMRFSDTRCRHPTGFLALELDSITCKVHKEVQLGSQALWEIFIELTH